MYRFWVFLHLLGMAGFLVSHGVSMAALFQVRAAGPEFLAFQTGRGTHR